MKLLIVLSCILVITCALQDTEEANRVKTDPKCKIPCSPGVVKKFTHPTECSKYANCENGKVTFGECPPGKIFNYMIQDCQWSMAGSGQLCVPCYLRRPFDY